MKIYRIIILIVLVIGFFFAGCEEKDNYEPRSSTPVGGFIENNKTIMSEHYLDDGTGEVSVIFEANRIAKGENASYSIDTISLAPYHISNAFQLTNKTVTIGRDSLTQVIGEVDWSKMKSGDSLLVGLKVVEDENFETSYSTKELQLTLIKKHPPKVNMGSTIKDLTFPVANSWMMDTTLTIEVLDKPAREDITMPLALSSGSLERGVHFDIDTVLHIAKGETTDEVSLQVYGDQFSSNDQGNISLEARSDDVPVDIALEMSPNNSKTFKIGNAVNWLYLNKDKTYSALIDSDYLGEDQRFQIELTVLGAPAKQDINVPISLNEYNVQEGTHFHIPDPVARISKGETTCTLDIYVYNDAFNPGESSSLWIELYQANVPEGLEVIIDPDFWWTTINIGQKE